MKKVEFEVDAKKYFEVDAGILERVQEGEICLVTIDFENEKADYIWYNPDADDPVERNPASHPAIEDDFDGIVRLWEELGKPGSEPNTIVMKENFPIDGEAYTVGEQMGRYFFAWGPEYPYSDELPSENITDGVSGIEWFETEEEALHAYLDAVEAFRDTLGESPTEKVMTAKEADERWGFADGFVRQSILRGLLKKHLDSGHIRKSAGTWLVSEAIMREVYGEPDA